MVSKLISLIKVVLTVFISSFICVYALHYAYNILSPYYVEAQTNTSEEAICKILEEKYPSAYTPYKNLDNLIYNYPNITHIYKLSFAQKMPLYVYTIHEKDFSSDITYLLILDSLGYVEDLIFLPNGKTPFALDYLTDTSVLDTIRGQQAQYLDIDATTSVSTPTDHIYRGIESATSHFSNEVQSK